MSIDVDLGTPRVEALPADAPPNRSRSALTEGAAATSPSPCSVSTDVVSEGDGERSGTEGAGRLFGRGEEGMRLSCFCEVEGPRSETALSRFVPAPSNTLEMTGEAGVETMTGLVS